MERRNFIKNATIGSTAIVSGIGLPALAQKKFESRLDWGIQHIDIIRKPT